MPVAGATALALILTVTAPASAQSPWVPAVVGLRPADGVNDAGHLVGGDVNAVLWTADGGTIFLGTLGGSNSRARAINNVGQVVGASQTGAWPPESAFLWTSSGGMVELEIGANPSSISGAVDINDAGQVVGYRNRGCQVFGYAPPTPSCTGQAFLWSATGGTVDLGTLGGSFASAEGINSMGHVAGTSLLAGGEARAFLWTAAGGMIDLGTLGGNASWAYAINDPGHVVGASTTAGGQTHAFLWTAGDGMIDLGTLGGASSVALAINNAGQVLVQTFTTATDVWSSGPPFVWTPDAGMTSLPVPSWGCQTPSGPAPQTLFVRDISNAGHIAGTSFCQDGSSLPSAVGVLWRGGEDLAIDFGAPHGTWVRTGTVWTPIHNLSPTQMVTADLDGNSMDDVVADFGSGAGVWALVNRTSWIFIHSRSPSRIATGDLDADGRDEIVAVFPGFGTWVWNGGTWTRLHHLDASLLAAGQLDGEAGQDLVLDFPGFGLYVWMNNSTWTLLHAQDAPSIVAADLDGNGQDDVVVDFAGAGIWAYMNNSAWVFLNDVNAVRLAAGDVDGNGQADLVADFGPAYGLWILRNGTTWEFLHGVSAERLVLADLDATGKDEIVVDFGPAYGLWQYANDRTWSQLHTLSPRTVTQGRFH